MTDALIKIGLFTVPHGVKGQIKVRCYTEHPDTVVSLGSVTTQSGHSYTLTRQGSWKEGLIVSVRGISDRTQAEVLRGETLYVRRSQLPDLTCEDEIYHVDLIGHHARVLGRDLTVKVVAFHNFGAGDIIEVLPSNLRQTVMVPFDRSFISILSEDGTIIIQDVPGLFNVLDEPLACGEAQCA